MSKLNPERKLPQPVIERIVKLFHQQAKPIYLGAVCLEVGVSIARAQEAVDDLCDKGIVRAATNEEKRSVGMSERSNSYTLVGPPNLTLAYRWPGE